VLGRVVEPAALGGAWKGITEEGREFVAGGGVPGALVPARPVRVVCRGPRTSVLPPAEGWRPTFARHRGALGAERRSCPLLRGDDRRSARTARAHPVGADSVALDDAVQARAGPPPFTTTV